VPDHSTLSRMRQRLDEEVFSKVFDVVLGLVAQHGLLQGKTLGVDSTQLRADASMKAIVRKDTKRLAAAAGESKVYYLIQTMRSIILLEFSDQSNSRHSRVRTVSSPF